VAIKGRKRKKRGIHPWRIVVLVLIFGIGAWWWAGSSSHEPDDRKSGDPAALRALRKRAEREDIPAQIELAERFCSGKGVKKNVFQCAEWYRKAANLGSGTAMLRIGDLYASGEGFILDRDAAAMWWRKAESTADGADGAKRRLQGMKVGGDHQK